MPIPKFYLIGSFASGAINARIYNDGFDRRRVIKLHDLELEAIKEKHPDIDILLTHQTGFDHIATFRRKIDYESQAAIDKERMYLDHVMEIFDVSFHCHGHLHYDFVNGAGRHVISLDLFNKHTGFNESNSVVIEI